MNETSSEGKKIYSARRIFIATAIFFFALLLRWAPDEPIPPFDDLYHAKRIAFSAQHFPRVLEFDPDRGLAGAFCPWPPLYDLTAAALSHVVDVRWLPPFGFALFAAALAFRSTLLALGVALSPYLIGVSRTSHIDHHWVEPMLMLAIVLATRAHRGVALGISIACALFVQPAFLVAAALAFIALFLDDAHEEGLTAFAIAAVAVVAYRVTRPFGYPDSAWFLGWPHAAALLGAASAFFARHLECGDRSHRFRTAKAAASSSGATDVESGDCGRRSPNTEAKRRGRVCALALGSLVTLSFPQTATAFLTGTSFFGGDRWLSTILEFQPMFRDPAAIGTDIANLTGGALLAFAIVRRERTVALFAIAYLLLALTSRRFLVPGVALFVLAGALAAMHARTRIAALAAAALTILPPLAYDVATWRDPWPRYDHVYRLAADARNLPPGRVLAPWSYGHAIDVAGGRAVVIDNFGSTPNAMEFDDAMFALNAGGRALDRYVRRHGVIVVGAQPEAARNRDR